MKSISSRMAALALTLSLGFAAGSANAVALTFNGWNFTTPGVASTAFSSSGLSSSATYNDWLNFSLPGGSDGSGAANVIALRLSTPYTGIVNYFRLLDLTTSSYVGTTVASGAGYSVLAFSGASVPGSYQLEIGVSGTNSYSGSIATPVPEPETYAMMLAGLGLLGFSARRRNKNI